VRLIDAGAALAVAVALLVAGLRFEEPEPPYEDNRGSWAYVIDAGAHDRASAERVAIAVAGVLGSPFPDEVDDRAWSERVLAGNEELRSRFAPDLPAQPFPEAAEVGSIATAAERMVRGPGCADEVPPLGGVAATLRRGEQPEAEWLAAPGVSGLVALELGRRGWAEDRALVEQIAAEGPSGSDRVAARYSLTRFR